jgi:hypothetical protein
MRDEILNRGVASARLLTSGSTTVVIKEIRRPPSVENVTDSQGGTKCENSQLPLTWPVNVSHMNTPGAASGRGRGMETEHQGLAAGMSELTRCPWKRENQPVRENRWRVGGRLRLPES